MYSGYNRFMEENGIYGIYQTAFRAHHSAETALVRIHNDIAQSIDSRRSMFLVQLDLSAAFDTINHNTLLRRLFGHGLSEHFTCIGHVSYL